MGPLVGARRVAGRLRSALQAWAERTPAGARLVRTVWASPDASGVQVVADQSIALIPDDLRSLVDIGIATRNTGAFDKADAIFDHILERDPAYPFALYELGFSRMLQGRHAEALEPLVVLLAARPGDPRAGLLAARLDFLLGETKAGARRLAAVTRDPRRDAETAMLGDFGRYMHRYPRSFGTELSLSVERRFASAADVAARIRASLVSRSGFSMIRLGDGEGAFLTTPDEADFPSLTAYNREDRARVWFAGELDLEASGFLSTSRDLLRVAEAADVLGAPYSSWVAHEYTTGGITGVVTLVNTLRGLDDWGRGRTLCRQTIHHDLYQPGHLTEIIRGETEIGLIACHPQLPDRLREAFGVKHVEFHKLPGEKLMADKIGPEATKGVHYPDVFRRILLALDRPLDGKLFLVAGGILGKFYCDRIKRSGGVALDVGSLVDVWVGAPTRPGYDTLQPL